VTITVPPPSTDCGDFCQPNFGDILANQLNRHPVAADTLNGLIQSDQCAYDDRSHNVCDIP
jgi:hypothetical protein